MKMVATKKKVVKVLPLWDQRMFEVINVVINNRINGIKNMRGFCNAIKMKEQGITQIKAGKGSFTLDQIKATRDLFGLDGNFFLDKTHTQMFKHDTPLTPLQQLRLAVSAVAVELNK